MTTYKSRKSSEIRYCRAPRIFLAINHRGFFFSDFPFCTYSLTKVKCFLERVTRITTFHQQHRPAQKTGSQSSPHQAPSNTGLKAARLTEWHLKECTSKHHAEKDKSTKLIICYQWEPILKVGMRINLCQLLVFLTCKKSFKKTLINSV